MKIAANRIVNRLLWETRHISPDRLKRVPQGSVPAHYLFAEVFKHREEYPEIIEALKSEGLADLFEITPEVRQHVEFHQAKLQEELGHAPSEVELAKRLMHSMIPALCIKNRPYDGLSRQEGGLSIIFNRGPYSVLRKQYGEVTPTQLLSAKPRLREASCRNISVLLAVCLRSAGIKASVAMRVKDSDKYHFCVIASLDGDDYKLDPTTERNPFAKTDIQPCTDSKILGTFYALYSYNRSQQLEFREARTASLLSRQILPA